MQMVDFISCKLLYTGADDMSKQPHTVYVPVSDTGPLIVAGQPPHTLDQPLLPPTIHVRLHIQSLMPGYTILSKPCHILIHRLTAQFN